MKRMSKKSSLVAIATSAVVVAGGLAGPTSPAVAADEGSGDVIQREQPSEASSAEVDADVEYSDTEIVGLILFGEGRAADENPDLAKRFKPEQGAEKITDEGIDALTKELIKTDPEFHEKVTVKAQQGSTESAKAAVERLETDIKEMADTYEDQSSDIKAQGKGKLRTNYVANSNIVALENVTVVVEVALAGIVVGVAAVAYRFEGGEPTPLEREETFKDISNSL